MNKKIFSILIIFIFSISCVNAADFNIPDYFTQLSPNHYENNGIYLNIVNYTNNSNFNWFKSDPALEYSVHSYKNNTYVSHSTDEDNVFELIEFEGKRYIVQCWSSQDNNDTNFKNLMEFNKLNNLTGINP